MNTKCSKQLHNIFWMHGTLEYIVIVNTYTEYYIVLDSNLRYKQSSTMIFTVSSYRAHSRSMF